MIPTMSGYLYSMIPLKSEQRDGSLPNGTRPVAGSQIPMNVVYATLIAIAIAAVMVSPPAQATAAATMATVSSLAQIATALVLCGATVAAGGVKALSSAGGVAASLLAALTGKRSPKPRTDAQADNRVEPSLNEAWNQAQTKKSEPISMNTMNEAWKEVEEPRNVIMDEVWNEGQRPTVHEDDLEKVWKEQAQDRLGQTWQEIFSQEKKPEFLKSWMSLQNLYLPLARTEFGQQYPITELFRNYLTTWNSTYGFSESEKKYAQHMLQVMERPPMGRHKL